MNGGTVCVGILCVANWLSLFWNCVFIIVEFVLRHKSMNSCLFSSICSSCLSNVMLSLLNVCLPMHTSSSVVFICILALKSPAMCTMCLLLYLLCSRFISLYNCCLSCNACCAVCAYTAIMVVGIVNFIVEIIILSCIGCIFEGSERRRRVWTSHRHQLLPRRERRYRGFLLGAGSYGTHRRRAPTRPCRSPARYVGRGEQRRGRVWRGEEG